MLRNQVQLIGRLGKDPDVKHLDDGKMVANKPIYVALAQRKEARFPHDRSFRRQEPRTGDLARDAPAVPDAPRSKDPSTTMPPPS